MPGCGVSWWRLGVSSCNCRRGGAAAKEDLWMNHGRALALLAKPPEGSPGPPLERAIAGCCRNLVVNPGEM